MLYARGVGEEASAGLDEESMGVRESARVAYAALEARVTRGVGVRSSFVRVKAE